LSDEQVEEIEGEYDSVEKFIEAHDRETDGNERVDFEYIKEKFGDSDG